MNKNRKKKLASRPEAVRRRSRPRLVCGWCGEPIRPGDESDNLYEPDDAYKDRLSMGMEYVHKAHVPEEDHPLYDYMPHIVFTGLPDELADAR